ncbi:MAG: RlmE family RNA methyltransferase [Deltaproteobacteria bacterium]|jgi:23S rRNA (uridine2552-2'-O)-methyltransferase|nr:RlmE family RNA methyltransferase [Deltaproteobacteria bacterium]
MKRFTKKHKQWQDHYTQRAKRERFPARSVYKLQEIQKKYTIIKKGNNVLDLGCAPGSWLLYSADLTGNTGRVIGIDLEPVTVNVPSHVRVYTADILLLSDDFFKSLGTDFNVVLSDMAPSTTGNKFVDSTRSFDLCRTALSIAQMTLIAGGSFVCKIFQGEDFKTFIDSVRSVFKNHKIFKPKSSRKASKEIYVIAFEKK